MTFDHENHIIIDDEKIDAGAFLKSAAEESFKIMLLC